jgi:hypothetical protein
MQPVQLPPIHYLLALASPYGIGVYLSWLFLKLNGTHQLLAYADDVNLLGDNIDIINKKTETLTDASKEVGLEVNV